MLARPLTVDDLTAYRALHRFALAHAPYAFAETSGQDAARTDAEVAATLARGETWGLLIAERVVGKLVIDTPPYEAFRHTRWLHGVFVHPDARGAGAADVLVRGAIADAQQKGAVRILLWVNAENRAARRFYEKLGFLEAGRIDQGIAVDGGLVDDVLMQLKVGP